MWKLSLRVGMILLKVIIRFDDNNHPEGSMLWNWWVGWSNIINYFHPKQLILKTVFKWSSIAHNVYLEEIYFWYYTLAYCVLLLCDHLEEFTQNIAMSQFVLPDDLFRPYECKKMHLFQNLCWINIFSLHVLFINQISHTYN